MSSLKAFSFFGFCSKGRVFIYLLISAVVGFLVSFIAAPFLRVIHQNISAWIYVTVSFLWLGIFGLYPRLGLPMVLLFMLWWEILIYRWFERKFPLQSYLNIFLSVFMTSLLGMGILGVSYYYLNQSFLDVLKIHMKEFDQILAPLGFKILYLFPGLIFFLNLTNMVFAVALDRKAALMLRCPLFMSIKSPRLFDFKVWDYAIWPFMFCLFGSFFRGFPEIVHFVCINGVLILGSLYFFQGIAVIESALYLFKAGLLVRILLYIFLSSHIFIVGLIVGLVDFWLDLRQQLIRLWQK